MYGTVVYYYLYRQTAKRGTVCYLQKLDTAGKEQSRRGIQSSYAQTPSADHDDQESETSVVRFGTAEMNGTITVRVMVFLSLAIYQRICIDFLPCGY